MSTKKEAQKARDKRGKDDPKPLGGPWPDPHSREQISQGEADSDAGKHAKNPDWQKKW